MDLFMYCQNRIYKVKSICQKIPSMYTTLFDAFVFEISILRPQIHRKQKT